jgi:RNA polymerase sigma factor (sigma-70 family)
MRKQRPLIRHTQWDGANNESDRVKMDERQQRFKELYESTSPRIVAYALRRSGSPENAADVVAESFTIAWRHLDDLRNVSEGLPWMYAICRRVVANHLRSARRRTELTERIGAELLHATSESPNETQASLAAGVLQRLDESDREILMLVAWEGLDTQELAHALECSPTAARIRLHRARKRLGTLMENFGLEEKHSSDPTHTQKQEPVATEEPTDA